MKLSRLIAVLSAAALLAGALPVLAEGETLPAACNGTSPALAEGETLVEHTLYFDSETPVGNVDAAEAFANFAISDKKSMSPDAPTGTQDKIDVMAAVSNDKFNGNPTFSYFQHVFDTEQRFVCASTTFFAATQGPMQAKLFADKAWGDVEPNFDTAAVATGSDQVKSYTANFGVMDLEVWENLVIQLTTETGGAVLYGSTARPSSFTYVTIEQAPTPTPTATP